MKDHQLGYVPAACDEFREQYVHPFPLGMPRRVIEEYEARAQAHRKATIAEVNRQHRMNEVRVLWRSMTEGDREGLMARGDVNPERVRQLSQPKKRCVCGDPSRKDTVHSIDGPCFQAPRFVNPFDVYGKQAAKQNALAFNHGPTVAQAQAQAQQGLMGLIAQQFAPRPK